MPPFLPCHPALFCPGKKGEGGEGKGKAAACELGRGRTGTLFRLPKKERDFTLRDPAVARLVRSLRQRKGRKRGGEEGKRLCTAKASCFFPEEKKKKRGGDWRRFDAERSVKDIGRHRKEAATFEKEKEEKRGEEKGNGFRAANPWLFFPFSLRC